MAWKLCTMASYRMRPHLVTDTAVHARNMVRTNLPLTLAGRTTIATANGEITPATVTQVGQWVDEPPEVAELVRRRLSAPLR